MACFDARHHFSPGSVNKLVCEALQAVRQGTGLRELKLASFVTFSRADELDDFGNYVNELVVVLCT
jgi:hypothetical protein